MVILGIGGNLGDRLLHLRKALQAIRQLKDVTVQQVSPLYLSDALLPENAPADWDRPYFNFAIRCEVSIEPHELLPQLKKIEWSIGRKPEKRHWGPREIDIDILAWDDRIIETEALTVPHINLIDRPFALWPLADVAPFWSFPLAGEHQGQCASALTEKWGSRFLGQAPFHTRQINQRIDAPTIVGILNITPDSFSDGGVFSNTETALAHAQSLIEAGAEILDIGAESTAPNATPITPDQEWARLFPVLSAIKQSRDRFLIGPKISVDTRHALTAKKALDLGIDWINDVSGFNANMCQVVADSPVDCVMMHHVSLPASAAHTVPRHIPIIPFIYEWAEKQIALLEKNGIDRSRIIFDPGIGFGKTPEQSLMLIQEINTFRSLGTRILVGHSRKSFLSLFTALPAKERDIETLAVSLFLARQSIDFIRVHNVSLTTRAIKGGIF